MSNISTSQQSALDAAFAAQASAERMTEALKVSEVRYRRLFETARDGILILDSETGAIADANPFMTELLGYSHAELLGKELWQIGLQQDKNSSQETFQRLKREHYIRYEGLPLETQRGEQRQVEFVSNLYRENGHNVIQCNIRDITERKHLEDELANAQQQDKRIAIAIQRSLLFQPEENAFPGLSVSTIYAMASDEALVGGDFWDTFAFDNGQIALVCGDVMGHGLASAVFTAELKYTLRAYTREHEQPARVLAWMNEFVTQSHRLFLEGINTEGDDAPVCLALAVVERETGKGSLAIAGMEPPLLVRADGGAEVMTVTGMAMGILPDLEYTQVDFHLGMGDTLIMTTDGITESRRGKEFLGNAGLTRLAVAGRDGTLKEMADMIMSGAREFAGGILRDDATLVLVRRAPATPSPASPSPQ